MVHVGVASRGTQFSVGLVVVTSLVRWCMEQDCSCESDPIESLLIKKP